MNLSIEQTEELLKIISSNQLVAIGTNLGPDYLTVSDQELLMNAGIDYEYLPEGDPIFSQFSYGLLSEALGQTAFNNFTYDQLKEYIKYGQYIPLNFTEQSAINSIKKQTLNDLRTLNGKIFRDVNQVLIDNTLKAQQEFIKQEIAHSIEFKKTISEVAHTIAEKTGDWSRDFERIVAYNSHTAIEEGKAAMIQRDQEGKDPIVYKSVFYDACDSCVDLFLTKGRGSRPRLFKLSELKANGTNIGRKKAEWKATLGPIHPYCRCALHLWREGMIWDNKRQRFVIDIPYVPLRKKIKIWINGKEELV
jgi:hypothetical protein